MRLFTANYNPKVLPVYERLGAWLAERGIEFGLDLCSSPDETIRAGQGAQIALAFRCKMTRRVLEELPDLCLLMSSGIGYDHIDVEAATDLGIIVTNTATYCVQDVAEHALALILACARKLHVLDSLCRRGEYAAAGAKVQPVQRFASQTVGVVGIGRIGGALTRRLTALGFCVVACDPHAPAERFEALGVTRTDLNRLLAQADYVTLHTPGNQETFHLIGEAELRRMKTTAYLVNTSRGPVVDRRALQHALEEGWIAGAALDVCEDEPLQAEDPLLALDNLLITGHSAGTSVQSTEDWQQEWREILSSYLETGWPINVVNPAVEPKTADRSLNP